ncbi:MAG: tail fiber protein [Rhodanobacter sp.]
MTTPFVGEIQLFGFNFAPYGWASANGVLLPIAQNTALFSLLGTTYGGNGQTTFALPNFVARAACNQGRGPGLTPRTMGETFGENSVTLLQSEMPTHSHNLQLLRPSDPSKMVATPSTGNALAPPEGRSTFAFAAGATANASFAGTAIGPAGGSQPHENRQPYLAVNFCIALTGVYPSFS